MGPKGASPRKSGAGRAPLPKTLVNSLSNYPAPQESLSLRPVRSRRGAEREALGHRRGGGN